MRKDKDFKFERDGLVLCSQEPNSHVEMQFVANGIEDLQQATEQFLDVSDTTVIYDVGACVGTYAMTVAKRLPNARVYAFEPQAEMFARLRQNLALNEIQNVTTFNFGLSKAKNIGTLFNTATWPDGSINYGAASLHGMKGGAKNLLKETINLFNLDDVIAEKKLPLPKVVKVDIEGHEYEFLLGALETIQSEKPVFILEFNTSNFERRDIDSFAPVYLLKSFGYSFCDVRDINQRRKVANDIEYLWEKMILQDISDIVCIPPSDGLGVFRRDLKFYRRKNRRSVQIDTISRWLKKSLPDWLKIPLRSLIRIANNIRNN